MEAGIQFTYSVWWIPVCVIAALLFAAGMYYRERVFRHQEASFVRVKVFLATLRFLAVLILAILLLAPFLRMQSSYTEKPVIAFLLDNSASVKTLLDQDDSTELVNTIAKLQDQLGDRFDVEVYPFDNELRSDSKWDFKGKTTDLSSALSDLNDLLYNRPVGAVILASDGIYNQGTNPIYSGSQAFYPIHTIGLGDTTAQMDVLVSRIKANKIAYLDDRFPILTELEAHFASGESLNLTLSVYVPGEGFKKLESKSIDVNTEDAFPEWSVITDATQTGVVQYRVSVSPLEGEVTEVNNYKDVFIEILDNRQKILLLAEAPHPDIAAIRQTIESNKNFELEVVMAKDVFKANLNMEEYNLVIFHQLPSLKHPLKDLLNSVEDEKLSSFFIIGANTDLKQITDLNVGLQANKGSGVNEVLAAWNENFQLFKLPEMLNEQINRFPPLYSPFANYKASGPLTVLAFQKIGAVETDYPLISFHDALGAKTGFLCADGIWKWRMFDYLEHGDQEMIDELMIKIFQYLAVKSDKRKFRINVDKNIYNENEPVRFSAELYNDSYEPVNESDVRMTIIDEEGTEYPFTFNRTSDAYELNAGYLPVGNYTFDAIVALAGKEMTASGRFSVAPVQLEALTTTANHNLLFQLSEQTDGRLFSLANSNEIAELLLNDDSLKPVRYATYKTESVIHFKWIALLVAALLSIEWFIRKYSGGY